MVRNKSFEKSVRARVGLFVKVFRDFPFSGH